MDSGLTAEQIADCKQAFMMFDQDNSGSITVEELGAVINSLGQEMSEEELDSMISELDQNGDGLVDFEEFLSVMSVHGYEREEEEMRESFNMFDQNGDGFISLEELR